MTEPGATSRTLHARLTQARGAFVVASRSHATLAIAASLFAALLIVAWSPADASDSEAPRAEGPYLQIARSERGLDRLPLKSTGLRPMKAERRGKALTTLLFWSPPAPAPRRDAVQPPAPQPAAATPEPGGRSD